MNILRLLGQILLIYILYKLIFDFIIPIYRTANRVKREMREMNAKMHQQMNTNSYRDSQQQPTASQPPKHEAIKTEDYIDYEEIK